MDQRLETAQLMARFKLCLPRSLQSSVDLQKMTQDRDYAEQTLRETEDRADTEELLMLTLQLRDLLFPAALRQTGTRGRLAACTACGARKWSDALLQIRRAVMVSTTFDGQA